MNKIRLAIVDDHAVVLDGLKTMLNAFENLEQTNDSEIQKSNK